MIVIMPNNYEASIYNYFLQNLTQNQKVKADMLKDPDVGSIHRVYIDEIDYDAGVMTLDDGTRIDVYDPDYDILSNWNAGDNIIVGNNDDGMFDGRQYIFINAFADNFIRGDLE